MKLLRAGRIAVNSMDCQRRLRDAAAKLGIFGNDRARKQAPVGHGDDAWIAIAIIRVVSQEALTKSKLDKLSAQRGVVCKVHHRLFDRLSAGSDLSHGALQRQERPKLRQILCFTCRPRKLSKARGMAAPRRSANRIAPTRILAMPVVALQLVEVLQIAGSRLDSEQGGA